MSLTSVPLCCGVLYNIHQGKSNQWLYCHTFQWLIHVYRLTSCFIGLTCLVKGCTVFCLQNCLVSLWHTFTKVLEIPRHFAPYWHESITELLQICWLLLWWLEVSGGQSAHCNGPKTSVGWSDLCDLILLGVAIRRWSAQVMKGRTWSATIFREAARLKLNQSSCGSWHDKRHIHNHDLVKRRRTFVPLLSHRKWRTDCTHKPWC